MQGCVAIRRQIYYFVFNKLAIAERKSNNYIFRFTGIFLMEYRPCLWVVIIR